MATKRMLVDATHPEETRIVVLTGNRLEEFDFESASRRQLRGNIYLAKVIRVEPSLQAAFVDYGGNRHGFLAFSEIHPDYYQIPVADREALLRDEAASEAAEDHAEDAAASADDADSDDENGDNDPDSGSDVDSDQTVEHVGGGDALEEVPERRRPRARQYKIQEVIRRRQVMLVQVVKEERGNKGAALTTYLSLAGRYSVLMPNTARGGGISRKITNSADRKKLKEIASELEVPDGMGIILRTAGASRTKSEVKRDFEYLSRLWENVRSLTLQSQAPCLVYEEGSLIKRTIRDLYNKDIDEVLVAGDDVYREAKDFMRMIMPSHAKNVQAYKEDQPIYSKFGVESQLDSMFSPQVTLPSGGYIVLDPTEALVSIDVNSGRSTREHNIEDTALQTNLEAADEVARQLRLRDLAGLIVIDFIDMMEKRSIRQVERRMKDALKNDRARIQVGRISHFGLLEMSRQRIRFGVVESSTHVCPTCNGSGHVRSIESVAIMVMRAIEDHVLRKPGQSVNVRIPVDIALYILNSKRATLTDLESKLSLSITVSADAKLTGSQFAIERGEARQGVVERPHNHVRVDSAEMSDVTEDEAEPAVAVPEAEDGDDQPRRRRRRGRRGGRDRNIDDAQHAQSADHEEESATEPQSQPEEAVANSDEDGEGPRKRRRRGRRGGRRNRRGGALGEEQDNENEAAGSVQPVTGNEDAAPAVGDEAASLEEAAPAEIVAEKVAEPEVAASDAEEAKDVKKPARARRPRRKKTDEDAGEPETPNAGADAAEVVAEKAASADSIAEPVAKAVKAGKPDLNGDAEETPRRGRARKDLPEDGVVVTTTSADSDAKPKKAGWWQRNVVGQ